MMTTPDSGTGFSIGPTGADPKTKGLGFGRYIEVDNDDDDDDLAARLEKPTDANSTVTANEIR